MEAEEHASDMQHTDSASVTPTSTQEEEELMDDWDQNEPQTPSPTIPHCPEEEPDEMLHHQPIGQQREPEGAELQTDDGEDPGILEELLQETVDRLRMEMGRRTEDTGETQTRQKQVRSDDH